MKAILHYRAGPILRHRLAENPPDGWTVEVIDETDVDQFARSLPEADVLLHVLQPIGRAQMELAPRLKLIQKIGVGIDTIDLAAAEQLGIGVANMPGTNSQAVAELAIGLMLAVLRQVSALDRETRAGQGWSLPPERLERSGEIAGRTVGFIGFGEVPRRMAPVLAAFGARMIFHDPQAQAAFGASPLELNALLAEADIVTLHAPLVEATRGLIRAETLARMKEGAVLINTARGGLVDEAALLAALTSGRLLGAGLDVFAQEPVQADHPLLRLPNVVVLPHVAWLTPETIARSLGVAFENARRAISGETLLHEIRPVRRGAAAAAFVKGREKGA